MTSRDIIARWRARGTELAKLHAMVDGAALVDEMLSDLEQLATNDSLTLTQAADRSGYTTDHLSRLIRQGKLTNTGKKGSPRVLASELPKRPARKLADRSSGSYDPATDARLLRIRR